MRHLIGVTAVLMITISALGVATPERLIAMVAGWPMDTRFHVAVGTRLVLGVIFILGARACRFPAVIYAVGVMALAAAILLLCLGGTHVDALIQWWSRQPPLFIRAWCVVGVLLGMLILSSARRRGRFHGS